MRCLYCGKQLALFRKLTGGGEFCSDSHKHAYHEEYNKLALSRLMEAQTRQEDRGARTADAGTNAQVGATPPELAEPKARGGYLKQSVNPRSPGETALMPGEQEHGSWGVAGLHALPVALPETTGLDLVREEFVPEPEEPDPPKAGVIFHPRLADGSRAPIASLAGTPAELPIAVPPHDGVQFAPELSRPGMVATQGPVAGEVATPVAVAHFPPVAVESTCVLPAHRLEIRTSVVPAAASDPVRLDASPVPPPEAELRWESAAGFEFPWLVSESLEPEWVSGLELASSEERLAETLLANSHSPAAVKEIAETVVSDNAAFEDAAEPEVKAVVEAATPSEPETVAAPPVRTPVELILASATPEPVIDVNLLWSLFGSREEPAPAAKAEPAPERAPEPEPVIAPATGGTAEWTAKEPVEQPVEEAQESAPEESAAGGKSRGPQEAGSFLPVTIRPAGPPSKSRLMQSFQAIALVSANPQIPTWNMLPLRPKMTLGKAPPPGATASVNNGSASDARKGGSAVAVATAPAEESNTDVPMFGSLAKPRSGLSKWFKLGIAIGVISMAGGLYRPAGTGGSGRVARAREYMTTEFAVCRN
jgi:hypothetical protein